MYSHLRRWIRQHTGLTSVSLQEEVNPYLKNLKGVVFNAGAGRRPLETGLKTLNGDIDETAPVDILTDLHYIPLRDECVDSVISVAVLEHTRIPWQCTAEIFRVLKPGGTLVISVPFLQPEHAVPHDFFRYTVYGLQSMLEWAGFEVEFVERLGRHDRVLAWFLRERWEHVRPLILRIPLMMLVHWISARSITGERPPLSIYSGTYAIAHKPGKWREETSIEVGNPRWFFPLLVDPVDKSPLILSENGMINRNGQVYPLVDGKIDLRPLGNISQHREHWRK